MKEAKPMEDTKMEKNTLFEDFDDMKPKKSLIWNTIFVTIFIGMCFITLILLLLILNQYYNLPVEEFNNKVLFEFIVSSGILIWITYYSFCLYASSLKEIKKAYKRIK